MKPAFMCPGPYQDAIANRAAKARNLNSLAALTGLTRDELEAIIAWVSKANALDRRHKADV